MFFIALLDLALVLVLGTFLVTCAWLLIYRFCGFIMPNWFAGIFASGIIWVRHQKLPKLTILAIGASTIVDVLIWKSLWFWTIIIGGLVALIVWLFSKS